MAKKCRGPFARTQPWKKQVYKRAPPLENHLYRTASRLEFGKKKRKISKVFCWKKMVIKIFKI